MGKLILPKKWLEEVRLENPDTILFQTDDGVIHLEHKVKEGNEKGSHDVKVWSPLSKEWTAWFLPHPTKLPEVGPLGTITVWSESNSYSVLNKDGISNWKYAK